MNKVLLDEHQLLQLKRFIILRGVKEEDVIHEILDHFACKVEELMSDNISLPFEKAVEQAYYSFGYNGFKQMSEQYEKRLKRIVWGEFKNALPGVLKTKLAVISSIWCGSLFLLMFYLEQQHIEDWRHELLTYSSMGSIILFMGVNFYNSLIAKDGLADYHFDKNIKMWQKKVIRMPRIDSLSLPMIFIIPFLKINPSYWILYYTVITFLSLLNSLTRKETMKRMSFRFNTQYAHG